MSLVSLLAIAALVSMQYGCAASTMIPKNKGFTRIRPSKYVYVSNHPPEKVFHEPGVDLELNCSVMGSPIPKIQWLKNGEIIEDVIEESNVIFPENSLNSVALVVSSLIISSPSPNSEDEYMCRGIAGRFQHNASTTVITDRAEDYLQQLLAPPPKPRITYYFTTLVPKERKISLVLPCRVNSDLDVQLYWIDNTHSVVDENSKAKVLPSGDLLIPNLDWPDMGDYTCVVKNYLGEDSKTTFLYPSEPMPSAV